jgi:protein-disulfide isomerase
MTQRRNPGVLVTGLAWLLAFPALAADGDQAQPGYGNSLGQPTPAVMLPAPIPQVSIADDPVQGAADAPVTIVEFIDYQCPYCQGFAKETFPKLKAHYIDTGKVRYVARDFPLSKHSRARPAAIAAACAREQGRFWEMHDALLTAAGQLTEADFRRHAEALGLDLPEFDACRAEERHGAQLDAAFAAARAVGVSGTPGFLVGATRGNVAQGRLLQGDESYADFEKVLAGYLQPGK